MRPLFTTAQARESGLSSEALRWGEQIGRWRRIERGVYGDGPDDPTPLDAARARVLAMRGVASGRLAGVLHGFDGVALEGPPRRRRGIPDDRIVAIEGIRCADGLQTLIDLAAEADDDVWEQALESALRKHLTTVAELEAHLPELSRARTRGTKRIRRVLRRRPAGAPATESLLETLFIQLAREVPDLGNPVRQYEVFDADGKFVARVDVCWPDIGLFVELDGQHHEDQPVYDARRETAVVAATAWLPGRFTWREVVTLRKTTTRRLADLAEQACRRPLGRASCVR